MYPDEMKEAAKAMEAGIIGASERLWTGVRDESIGTRPPFERDYARILYASSFRRLQGKMQMLVVDHRHFHRNRLTHSMEVAQIASTIAHGLDLQCDRVAESCSLAHDLGNPPFGHRGERALDTLVDSAGGYEGNAQTFRILTFLERRDPSYRGLNLTRRTLLGVVKYFQQRDSGERKFLYDNDYAIAAKLREAACVDRDEKTIDVQIMDRADEIAYGGHDLEDCLRFRLFDIQELIEEFRARPEYASALPVLESDVCDARKFAREADGPQSSEVYSHLFRKQLTSRLVDRLVRALRIESNRLVWPGVERALAKGLKKLVFELVNRRTVVHLYEQLGELVIRKLFAVYLDEYYNRDQKLMPPEFRIIAAEQGLPRAVADYIGGMMDAFAVQEYQRYFGPISSEGAFREWGESRADQSGGVSGILSHI